MKFDVTGQDQSLHFLRSALLAGGALGRDLADRFVGSDFNTCIYTEGVRIDRDRIALGDRGIGGRVPWREIAQDIARTPSDTLLLVTLPLAMPDDPFLRAETALMKLYENQVCAIVEVSAGSAVIEDTLRLSDPAISYLAALLTIPLPLGHLSSVDNIARLDLGVRAVLVGG